MGMVATSLSWCSLVIACCATSGCATSSNKNGPKSLTEAAAAYAKAVASASELIRAEAKQKVSVRRDEAIIFYMVNGDDPTNITRGGEVRSFANYVCAGTGALQRELSAIDFANAYATSIESITKPAGDSFGEQWAKYLELRGPRQDLKDPGAEKTGAQRQSNCITEVSKLLPPKGVSASDVSNEAALAAILGGISALRDLRDSLSSFGARVVKGANEALAEARLREFVNANNERVARMLGTDLRPDVLLNAWERRKARTLVRPYYTFFHLINDVNPKTQPAQFFELATTLRTQLEEFDAMRTTTSPDRIVQVIAQAQKALYEAANNPESKATLLVFLEAIISDLDDIKKDYDEVEAKADAAKDAVGKI